MLQIQLRIENKMDFVQILGACKTKFQPFLSFRTFGNPAVRQTIRSGEAVDDILRIIHILGWYQVFEANALINFFSLDGSSGL